VHNDDKNDGLEKLSSYIPGVVRNMDIGFWMVVRPGKMRPVKDANNVMQHTDAILDNVSLDCVPTNVVNPNAAMMDAIVLFMFASI
jgi:hypothetical protein